MHIERAGVTKEKSVKNRARFCGSREISANPFSATSLSKNVDIRRPFFGLHTYPKR
jgi:hypothetical protein